MKIYNIIVLSVKAILIIIHQNIHGDSLPPPFIFFSGGNTVHVCVLACLHMPPVRYVFCVKQSQSKSEILRNVVKLCTCLHSLHL